MKSPDPLERPAPQSAVFNRPGPMGVRVSQRASPWNLALGLAFCVVLGVIVFASLSAGRTAHADNARAISAARAPTRPLDIGAVAARMPAPNPITLQPGPAAVAAVLPSQPPLMLDPSRRWRSPAMVVDLSEPAAAAPRAGPEAAGPPAAVEDQGALSAEERFSARVSSGAVDTVHATRLRDTARTVPQGTLIPAVLETAIDSDLPGGVRAVVSQDVRGFDGSTVLVPRGSRLVGQYRNGVAQGQSRVFVVWSRVLTPEGVSIEIGSPATDPLGRGGLEGETNTHFFARFGGAILLTVMNAGAEAIARRSGSATAIVIGGGGQTGLGAGLPKPADIPVTVKVPQGTPLQVFVTRDLDFSGLAPRR